MNTPWDECEPWPACLHTLLGTGGVAGMRGVRGLMYLERRITM